MLHVCDEMGPPIMAQEKWPARLLTNQIGDRDAAAHSELNHHFFSVHNLHTYGFLQRRSPCAFFVA